MFFRYQKKLNLKFKKSLKILPQKDIWQIGESSSITLLESYRIFKTMHEKDFHKVRQFEANALSSLG